MDDIMDFNEPTPCGGATVFDAWKEPPEAKATTKSYEPGLNCKQNIFTFESTPVQSFDFAA